MLIFLGCSISRGQACGIAQTDPLYFGIKFVKTEVAVTEALMKGLGKYFGYHINNQPNC